MAINLLLSAIAILAYIIIVKPSYNEIVEGELILAIWLLLVVYVFTFFIYVIWELQFVFSRIKIEKRNTKDGAYIVIRNNEIFDLTDLVVELFERKWIYGDGSVRIPIDPQNCLFDLGDETIVPYDGGTKTILLASAPSDEAVFNLQAREIDIGHEYVNDAEQSIYDIIVRVKGKIRGRTIFPQKLQGRLKYTSGEPRPLMYFSGQPIIDPDKYSKFEWEYLE